MNLPTDLQPEQIEALFRDDHYAEHLGIELLDSAPGRATAKLEIGKAHMNAVGVVHGGAIFSLADVAFAIASNAHGNVALGINVSISYLTSARGGHLIAEAEEVSLNPRLATYLIRIHDDQERLIAIFQGTVYRKRDRIDATGATDRGS